MKPLKRILLIVGYPATILTGVVVWICTGKDPLIIMTKWEDWCCKTKTNL